LALVAVLLVVIGAAVALGVTVLLPRHYVARTELIYQISAEQPTGFLREDRSLTTQVVLITSRTVLEPVAVAHGLQVDELTQRVSASIIEGSLVLDIKVEDRQPAVAVELASAISKRYLELVGTSDQPDVRGYLVAQLEEAQRQLRAAPPNALERPELAKRVSDVQQQLDQLQLRISTDSRAHVVVPPYALPDPVSPRPLVGVTTGAVAGLLVAAVVIGVAVRRRSSAGEGP